MKEMYLQDPYQRDHVTRVLQCEPVDNGFRVQLEETIFYPEGGGQPADHGKINSALVQDVQKLKDVIWHYVDQAVSLGDCLTSIDWRRRYDHMQQHTGQHLFTALALSEFELETVGFHLGAQVVGIELNTDSLTIEVAHSIAQRVNE